MTSTPEYPLEWPEEPLESPTTDSWGDFDQLLEEGEPYSEGPPACAYCGMPADTIDHVVPRQLLQVLRMLDDPGVRKLLYLDHRVKVVQACRECNLLLSSKYFDTFDERKRFLKDRLRSRYSRVLATQDWSEEELATLSLKMRGYVANSINMRNLVRARLRF